MSETIQTTPSLSDIRNKLKSQNVVGGSSEPAPLSIFIQEVRHSATNGIVASEEDEEWVARANRLRVIFINSLIFFICFAVIGIVTVGLYLLLAEQIYQPISHVASIIMDTRLKIAAEYGQLTLFVGDVLIVMFLFVIGLVLLRITLFRKDVLMYSPQQRRNI